VLKRLNGYAPWVGVVFSLVINCVMFAYFVGRMSSQVEAIAAIVADGKAARIELTRKVDGIDLRTARAEVTLDSLIKLHPPKTN
jgi:hypothetical protein